MNTIKVQSVAFTGIEAVHVELEIQKSKGLFGKINIVGLPGGVVKESKDRVRAAIESSGFSFPRSALIINLAPADLKKDGPSFDLPLALGILGASGVIPKKAFAGLFIMGELALDGRVKPVPGTLGAAILAQRIGQQSILVAYENRAEAELVDGLEVVAVKHLSEAAYLLEGPDNRGIASIESRPSIDLRDNKKLSIPDESIDFKDVVGQQVAKAAMVVAAAGGHNLLMIGPPGSGKTMLARRLPTVLPPLAREESLEVTQIHSLTQRKMEGLISHPPFRAPHHTISYAGLVGGGSIPGPGEISLAHKGILFLDELPEFARRTLEALRQPIEEGHITIARARGVLTLPAKISLVASMNPCPCGYRGDGQNKCICTPRQASLYLKRISGPLLDRLDLQIEVPALSPELIMLPSGRLDSLTMAKAVAEARKMQAKRNGGKQMVLNAHLTPKQIKKWCKVSPRASDYLSSCLKRYPLSARGYARILKVARTVADIDQSDNISLSHMEKAVMYRVLDRLKAWNQADGA